MQSMEEVKAACEAGKVVHWHSSAYKVRKSANGDWWIDCVPTGHIAPMSEGYDPNDFYVEVPSEDVPGHTSPENAPEIDQTPSTASHVPPCSLS